MNHSLQIPGLALGVLVVALFATTSARAQPPAEPVPDAQADDDAPGGSGADPADIVQDGAPATPPPPLPSEQAASEDEWVRRGIAGAVVAVPTVGASLLAAFVFPMGLAHWAFPILAVAIPPVTAGIASLFVVPWWWSWVPATAALAGTLVGFVIGAVIGLAAVSQIPEDAFGPEISPNLVVLLPTIGLVTALCSASSAGGAAMLLGGPIDDAE